VITKPDLIIADEPTGNVDDEMAIKLLYLFVELNRMGTAVIIATHSKALTGRFNYPVIEIKNKNVVLH
jgi:cell division transport system ATP-binding protein